MSQRVRDRGFRRRASGLQLVRTRPRIPVGAPPIALSGFIRRAMIPSFPGDAAAISDTAWTIGTTGGPNDANCAYVHFTFPSRRYSNVEKLMEPVRWSIAAPASDGGQYDHWQPLTSYGYPNYLTNYDFLSPTGSVGISEKLLPSTWHAEFDGGIVDIGGPNEGDWRLRPRTCIGNSASDYVESTLEAIAPSTQAWQYEGSSKTFPVLWSIYAIQHRINGSAVGSVITDPTLSDWLLSVSPGDLYEIDIWYKIYVVGYLNLPNSPGKACMYIPTTLVSNSSRRHLHAPGHYLRFHNVNFSRYFNYQEQTYQITIAGHGGWTLKDGSDGPHKMISSSQWVASIQNGQIVWNKMIDDSYIAGIRLTWDQEHAQIAVRAGQSVSSSCTGAIYRIAHDGSHYRSSTTSTDYGTATHAGTGLFDQAGTTVFSLVSWSTEGGQIQTGYPSFVHSAEAKYGRVLTLLPVWLPTTITVTRVLQ